jgi:hypothetical protein
LSQYFLNGIDVCDLARWVDYKTEGGCLPGVDESSVSVSCVGESLDPKHLTHPNLEKGVNDVGLPLGFCI